MTTGHAAPQTPSPGRLTIVPIGSWTLWLQPRRVLFYVLCVQLATVALTVGTLATRQVTSTELTHALVLWACAAVYIEATPPIERIRERASRSTHTDLNSIWTFAAVLLVHPALIAVIVSANYLHRWLRVRHHVVHRQAFSAAATVLSGYAAAGVLSVVDTQPVLTSAQPTVGTYFPILAAGVTYFVTSTALLAGALAASKKDARMWRLAADPGDAALELAGVGLGVLIAWS